MTIVFIMQQSFIDMTSDIGRAVLTPCRGACRGMGLVLFCVLLGGGEGVGRFNGRGG